MKLYKLTEQDHTTYNRSTLWGEGVTHSLPQVDNPQLCSGQVLHAYTNANLAFLLNPIHADIKTPILWEASGEVVVTDFGKVGCFGLTTEHIIAPPKWVGSDADAKVRVMFAVLCAEAVLGVFETHVPGDERPRRAIEAAKKWIKNPSAEEAEEAEAAAWAAEAATWAAWAARAAEAAAWAARAAEEAEAAAEAARAAAEAARAAARAAAWVNFDLLADQAVQEVENETH